MDLVINMIIDKITGGLINNENNKLQFDFFLLTNHLHE